MFIASTDCMIRLLRLLLVAECLIFGAISCGGSTPDGSGSPTGPSGSFGALPSGAVILGTVFGRPLAPASQVRTLDAPSALTVSVAGTSLTVTVDGSGHFEIFEVPAGNVELVFREGSSAWRVAIAGVAEEEQIQIQINLSSGTPTIVSLSRSVRRRVRGDLDTFWSALTRV
jgi:hypothetical protein